MMHHGGLLFSSRTRGGSIIIDIILAFSLAAMFISTVTETSSLSRKIFIEGRTRKDLLQLFDEGKYEPVQKAYGNEMRQTFIDISTSTGLLNFETVNLPSDYDLFDAVGTPLCSVKFGRGPASITAIMLPISPLLPLTDIEVRNGIAYVSTDSSTASVADILIINIKDGDNPLLVSSLNTGPGIASLSLAGKRIYAAAASTAYQLHVIRLDGLANPVLEARYKLPQPEASSTPQMGSTIFYKAGKVFLGTEKMDGDEFNIIDVSNPLNPVKIGGLEIGSKVNEIYVNGEYAFVAGSGFDQMALVDVNDQGNPTKIDSFSPSGWSRQEGKVIQSFENELHFGRTSGGYNRIEDHELFSFASASSATTSDSQSKDIPGGIYGIISDRENIYISSLENGKEFQIINRAGFSSSSVAYSIPVAPQSMTCDRDRMYVLARTAPYIYEISFK